MLEIEKFKIGIIDDMIEEETIPRKNRFNKKIYFKKIKLFSTLEEIINNIIDEKFDGLIIDQKLNTGNSDIEYNGTDISKKIVKKRDIPFLFWSSNVSDIEDQCTSEEVNLTFSNDDSQGNDFLSEESLIMKKLILKIRKQKEEIKNAENELLSLEEDSDLEKKMELDNFISDKIYKNTQIEKARKIIDTKKLNELLESLEKKIKDLKNE